MFTPTIFLPEIKSNEKNVTLDNSKVHHLKNVLRVKDFDSVNITNGVGELFQGRIVKDYVEINSQKKYLQFIMILKIINKFVVYLFVE